MKFCASQRWMEDCFPSLFWICFSAAIWSEALALFRKLSLLISLHRPCSNCFKRIFNLFQTAKVSLDFKRLSASLNDKWINSERELWRWKRAGNKWRSTCLNCKSKNWNVFSTLFKQFLIVLIRCCAFFAYCCYFFLSINVPKKESLERHFTVPLHRELMTCKSFSNKNLWVDEGNCPHRSNTTVSFESFEVNDFSYNVIKRWCCFFFFHQKTWRSY